MMENGRKAVKFFFHCLSSLEEERKLKACFFLPWNEPKNDMQFQIAAPFYASKKGPIYQKEEEKEQGRIARNYPS